MCFSHKDAAEFLLKAAQWNEAHKVIIEHIAPKAIINGGPFNLTISNPRSPDKNEIDCHYYLSKSQLLN